MLHKRKKALIFLMSLSLFTFPQKSAFAETKAQYPISSGVQYKYSQEVINTYPQAINLLEINTADTYTQLDLSYPDPLNTLAATSAQAKRNHYEGHRVIGAVNGSFFDMKSKLPMYLISYNNKLVNLGLTQFESEHYVNKPAAFGVNSSGKAQIEDYSLSVKMTHSGSTKEITSINKIREANELILYTPENITRNPGTNQWGYEVVFTNASKNRDLAFGDRITGTVQAIRPFGDTTVPTIPEDGFILSAHGDKQEALKSLKPGDTVQIDLSIDSKWQNSRFMLASGPMLVNNGAYGLNMDSNNIRARERAPRTAIAIDKTQTKVFMVTVDGRQSGYSSGMTLPEFANYLIKIGAYKAINLDGGGSTAMAIRKQGQEYPSLINRPSDGWERSVSSTLQVISTAPIGNPKYINASLSKSGEVIAGTSVSVELKTVLDQFYNPLPKDLTKLKVTTTLGEVQGNTVSLTKPGQAVITASYGEAVKKFTVNVTEEETEFSDVPASYKYYKEITALTSQQIITGYPDGTFRPNTTISRMEAALLLTRALKLDTENVQDVDFRDVPKDHKFYKEIAAVASKGIMVGKSENYFDLSSNLTRAEMAVILHRAFNLSGSEKVPFTDVTPETFGYYSISTLLANDITEGFPDNTYRPKESLNRFQFALFLYRILN
ncbi:phosphodiester glycosidase family protein [Bacillus sp. ISL-47]|uniref:phosphodiester glycosidase family protein n=1 Tax=Bacillus sp. ISL-47 TaxID=2819130 RepID=UPI001BE74471|nr:phosphodiester glycosidase family protein [Bacillus sp. ISL-47]MBT2687184.1 phosphodiester glycosidase family protein [Bacillus sp. ISL-47]MBT2709784.1 phosphodiester glycosidase family protein [Pseudomonas sp. ISL-84]